MLSTPSITPASSRRPIGAAAWMGAAHEEPPRRQQQSRPRRRRALPATAAGALAPGGSHSVPPGSQPSVACVLGRSGPPGNGDPLPPQQAPASSRAAATRLHGTTTKVLNGCRPPAACAIGARHVAAAAGGGAGGRCGGVKWRLNLEICETRLYREGSAEVDQHHSNHTIITYHHQHHARYAVRSGASGHHRDSETHTRGHGSARSWPAAARAAAAVRCGTGKAMFLAACHHRRWPEVRVRPWLRPLMAGTYDTASGCSGA